MKKINFLPCTYTYSDDNKEIAENAAGVKQRMQTEDKPNENGNDPDNEVERISSGV